MTSEATPRLRDFLILLKDGTHNPPERSEEGIRFIAGATDIKYLDINFSRCTYVDEETFSQMHKKWQPLVNDVLLTIVGTVGNTAIVKKEDTPFTMQRSIATLRPKENLYFRYLFYWLNSYEAKWAINSRITATGQPGIYLGVLGGIPFSPPDYDIQIKISEYLYKIDILIQTGKILTETIDDFTSSLFRSWFIDFNPIKNKSEGRLSYGMDEETTKLFSDSFIESDLGLIPDSWKVGKIIDLFFLQRGFDLPAHEIIQGPYEVSASSGIKGHHNEFKVKGPGVCTGRSGSLGNVHFVHGDFWPAETVLWVKEYRQSNPYFAYHLLKSMDLKMLNCGSAVPILNRNHLHSMPFVIPPMEIIEKFGELVKPFFVLKNLNTKWETNLVDLRNILLQRLMSGELKLN